jgi:hypothetical protein
MSGSPTRGRGRGTRAPQTEEREPADHVDDPAQDASTTALRNCCPRLCHHCLLVSRGPTGCAFGYPLSARPRPDATLRVGPFGSSWIAEYRRAWLRADLVAAGPGRLERHRAAGRGLRADRRPDYGVAHPDASAPTYLSRQHCGAERSPTPEPCLSPIPRSGACRARSYRSGRWRSVDQLGRAAGSTKTGPCHRARTPGARVPLWADELA